MPDEQTNIVQSVITHAAQIAVLEERQKTQEASFTQELEQIRGDIEEIINSLSNTLQAAIARITQLEQTPEKAQRVDQVTTASPSEDKTDQATTASPSEDKTDQATTAKAPNVTIEEPVTPFRFVRRNGRKVKRPAIVA